MTKRSIAALVCLGLAVAVGVFWPHAVRAQERLVLAAPIEKVDLAVRLRRHLAVHTDFDIEL